MKQAPNLSSSVIIRELGYSHKLILEVLFRTLSNSPRSAYLTRLQLIQKTGLVKDTISSNLKALTEWGLVERSGEVKKQKGRPKSFYRITSKGVTFFIARFSPHKLAQAIANHILQYGSAPERLSVKLKRRKEARNRKSRYTIIPLQFSYRVASPPCLECKHFPSCNPANCTFISPGLKCPECGAGLITPPSTNTLTCSKCGVEYEVIECAIEHN